MFVSDYTLTKMIRQSLPSERKPVPSLRKRRVRGDLILLSQGDRR